MKIIEIWLEGQKETTATILSEVQAKNFKQACDKFFSIHPDKNNYDPKKLVFGGKRLFDNEVDARKKFG